MFASNSSIHIPPDVQRLSPSSTARQVRQGPAPDSCPGRVSPDRLPPIPLLTRPICTFTDIASRHWCSFKPMSPF